MLPTPVCVCSPVGGGGGQIWSSVAAAREGVNKSGAVALLRQLLPDCGVAGDGIKNTRGMGRTTDG